MCLTGDKYIKFEKQKQVNVRQNGINFLPLIRGRGKRLGVGPTTRRSRGGPTLHPPSRQEALRRRPSQDLFANYVVEVAIARQGLPYGVSVLWIVCTPGNEKHVARYAAEPRTLSLDFARCNHSFSWLSWYPRSKP